MASSSNKLFFLLLTIFFSNTCAVHSSNTSTEFHAKLSSLGSFCRTTPYPEVCYNSLKLSISINISPNIITYLLQSLQVAISEATKLSILFQNVGQSNIIEKQRGAVQDCRELHQSTLASLKRSLSTIRSQNSRNLVDARAYLSAALTNKNTCLEGLDSASGTLKPVLVNSVINTYKHVSNSLSVLSKPGVKVPKGHKNRRLMSAPTWSPSREHDLLQSLDGEEYNPNEVLVVAADGTGNFSSITEAINYAPNNSVDRTVIYVKRGIYEEYVEIPSSKTNMVMLGDGSDVTVITGNRSVVDGWTTFRSATLAVSGDGFLARDIAFVNSAGPKKHQAVALRVNADLTAFYRCAIYGYQDTLYVHSFRQFYRECDIYGTVDFIFGNAAVVLQECNIVSRMPLPGQFTVITAQSRDNPNEDTGISIQNCSIIATNDLYSNSSSFKSYLGRPWRVYSRTVFLESYIGDFIDPKGWTKWSNDQGLHTLYYAEYENYGPGSRTDNRVEWLGYHLMDYNDAYNFSVSEFISGDAWLESTSFPYDDGI
ncbi:probable pectinesterase/pectinesterase inhibitor 12 [Gastrolobium bilobum]|uniref:probable pectinesterase/pectinesterase inhibitor 12 n=1 Tax=Gastrolobium bilobum TaxID=150636 RepID=UPI002AB1261D|nr:probable pectinesterase/pectinesterase inhibitor 12 [Gastrolobium bilobum]